MLIVLLTMVHIIVCFFLIVVVLLQSGKAADLAGAFGGMGSQTTFGPRGSATVLSKATTTAAVIFMITSMWLAILATRHAGTGSSVLDKAGRAARPASTVPATPGSPVPNIHLQQPGAKPIQVPVNVGGGKAVPENANQPEPAKK